MADLWNHGSRCHAEASTATGWSAGTTSPVWPLGIRVTSGDPEPAWGLLIPGEGDAERLPKAVTDLLVTVGTFAFDLTFTHLVKPTSSFAKTLSLGQYDSEVASDYAGGPITSIAERFELRKQKWKSGPNADTYRHTGMSDWRTGCRIDQFDLETGSYGFIFRCFHAWNGSIGPVSMRDVIYHADHDLWDLTQAVYIIGDGIAFFDRSGDPGWSIASGHLDCLGHDLTYWSNGSILSGSITAETYLPMSL